MTNPPMRKEVGKTAFLRRLLIYLGVFCLIIAPFAGQGSPVKAAAESSPILLGVYPEGWISQTTVDKELNSLDAWSGKRTSIAGFKSDIQDPNAKLLSSQLNPLWTNGFTPFINLEVGYFSKPTAAQIASGAIDTNINYWAQNYKSWAVNGKWAYIAILPNMNVPYPSYGRDPGNYKLAYTRIQSIFSQNGIPTSAVKWVFAPNGWVQLPFEWYYPGDSHVDIVGFSAYNDGACSAGLGYGWLPPSEVLGFSIKEMRTLAPTKPVFITRLGTTAFVGANQTNNDLKNQWLRDAYNYLAGQTGVKAVLYYNYAQSAYECDWAVYKKDSAGNVITAYTGYRDGIANPAFGYVAPGSQVVENLAAETQPSDLQADVQQPSENQAVQEPASPAATFSKFVYLPIVKYQPQGVSAGRHNLLLGIYSQNWPGLQTTMDNEYHAVDTWSGKTASLAGTFVDITSDPTNTIEIVLEIMLDNGYTPFINLNSVNSKITMAYVASGQADNYLRGVAQAYLNVMGYHHNVGFIAPFQEMNVNTVVYGGDPTNYKLAFRHIQQVFAAVGVPRDTVRWVFSPNGNSSPGMPGFEAYYPGNDAVDAVGISAYNFGYYPTVPSSIAGWHTPEVAIKPYLDEIIAMAPTKPVFISQTGTSAYSAPRYKDVNAKNKWLVDAYTYLSSVPNVVGVVYYNRWISDSDWSFYQKGGDAYIGYQQVMSNSALQYLSPEAMKTFNLVFH